MIQTDICDKYTVYVYALSSRVSEADLTYVNGVESFEAPCKKMNDQ